MRLPSFLFLLLSLAAAPALAQSGSNDTALYEVADVGVDVSADNAVHARDQAITQAQRAGFEQLLGRLGADSALAARLDDDGVALLVQNFEVQEERTSAIRYIGTFTVQFRPDAVRDWLNENGASFTEIRSKPIVVLPVSNDDGHPVLWEESTKWRAAWENAREGGLVPVIVPGGDLDDIAVLSTREAVAGNPEAIKVMIDKYQADGAVVAILNGDPARPGNGFRIDVIRYDHDGKPAEPVYLTMPPAINEEAVDGTLAQAVRNVRNGIESNWRQSAAKALDRRLPVVVPINTLADWALIKRKLGSVPDIKRTETVALARGAANIELEFRGDIGQLQTTLAQQNLALTQDDTNGVWVLQLAAPAPPL